MKILVAGLGLIGGSLCKAVKSKTDYSVIGLDNNDDVIKKALACGAIDEKADDKNIGECDYIIVCLHPEPAEKFMLENMSRFMKSAILTDVCGIKGKLVRRVNAEAVKYGIRYVGTHPMAGKERFGFDFSDGELFENANFIVTPVDDTDKDAVDTVINLAKTIGFGKIVITSPEEHDRTIAYTSQLAHVVSSAYVKSPTMLQETGFSGGSFQDMTRIATMNEYMWSSLFLSNSECLVSEIDMLIENLRTYRDAIENNDEAALRELIKTGRELKEENIKKRTAANLTEKN